MLARTLSPLRHVIAFAPARVAGVVVMGLAGALTTGFGLMLVIPLLALFYPELAGDAMGGAQASVADELEGLLSGIGVPLTLGGVLGLFVGFLTLQATVAYLRDRFAMSLRIDYVESLRLELYRAITRMRWDAYTAQRASDLTHILTTDASRVAQGIHNLSQLTTGLVMGLAYIGVALLIAPLFSLLVLAGGLLLALAIRPFNRRAHRQGQGFGEAHRDLMHAIQQHLASIKLSKCFHNEERQFQRFHAAVDQLRQQQLRHQHTSGMTHALLRVGGGVILSACIWLAVAFAKLPPAELLVMIYAFARLLPQINGLQQNYQHLLHLLPAFEAVHATIRECQQAGEPRSAAASPPLEHAIELRDIHYHYPDMAGQRHALHGVTLTLPARRTTALIGPSGAGKSTLADLILGLLAPSQGSITIDGTPPPPFSRRADAAYVPQETFLFSDTVAANLRWAQPQATDAELWQALELAAAAEFVRRMPEGLETIVGERGVKLSGGERQRLALARALLRRPSLLVLDEATSALDAISEARTSQAIEALHGNLTIVIIAHRLSTVRKADQLVVLDGGRVVEQGSWRELREKPGGYLAQVDDRTPL